MMSAAPKPAWNSAALDWLADKYKAPQRHNGRNPKLPAPKVTFDVVEISKPADVANRSGGCRSHCAAIYFWGIP